MSVSSVDGPRPAGEPAEPVTPRPPVEVRRSARRRKTVTAFREDGRVVVLLPARMSQAEERHWVGEMLDRVARREARSAPPTSEDSLLRRADDLATRFLDPARSAGCGPAPRPSSMVWVDNQQQRWGSCTPSTGAIRLSARLQRFPDWVVDYVIVHELCHLVRAHHDPAFWQLVAAYPRTAEARGYLQGWADAVARGDRPSGAGTGPGDPLPDEAPDVLD